MANTPTFRSRKDRDHARGRAASARVRTAGGTAMEAAFADLETRFGPAFHINSLKRGVEALIRRGFADPAVRARFRYYIGQIVDSRLSLDEACALLRVDRAIRDHRIRLPSMVRSELSLILRWMRRKRMDKSFAETVAAMQPRQMEAAE